MNWEAVNKNGIEVRERKSRIQPEIAYSCTHYKEGQAGNVITLKNGIGKGQMVILCDNCKHRKAI